MNNISPTSRNKREGTYKGKKCNKHFRSAKKYAHAKMTYEMILAERLTQLAIDKLKNIFNDAIKNLLYRPFIDFTNCLTLSADAVEQLVNHAIQDLTVHQSNQNTTAS